MTNSNNYSVSDSAVTKAFEKAMFNEVNWSGGPIPAYIVSDVCLQMGKLNTPQIEQVESMVHDLLNSNYFYHPDTPDEYKDYVAFVQIMDGV